MRAFRKRSQRDPGVLIHVSISLPISLFLSYIVHGHDDCMQARMYPYPCIVRKFIHSLALQVPEVLAASVITMSLITAAADAVIRNKVLRTRLIYA